MTDTARPVNGWTVDTLHEHLETLIREKHQQYDLRFEGIVTATQAALNAADRAVTKAETASEKRFEGVNEFRSALADQQAGLISREAYEAQHQALSDRVGLLTQTVSAHIGAASGEGQGWIRAWAVGATLIAVASIVLAILRG